MTGEEESAFHLLYFSYKLSPLNDITCISTCSYIVRWISNFYWQLSKECIKTDYHCHSHKSYDRTSLTILASLLKTLFLTSNTWVLCTVLTAILIWQKDTQLFTELFIKLNLFASQCYDTAKRLLRATANIGTFLQFIAT